MISCKSNAKSYGCDNSLVHHVLLCHHCTCVKFRRSQVSSKTVFSHFSSHRVEPIRTLRTSPTSVVASSRLSTVIHMHTSPEELSFEGHKCRVTRKDAHEECDTSECYLVSCPKTCCTCRGVEEADLRRLLLRGQAVRWQLRDENVTASKKWRLTTTLHAPKAQIELRSVASNFSVFRPLRMQTDEACKASRVSSGGAVAGLGNEGDYLWKHFGPIIQMLSELVEHV